MSGIVTPIKSFIPSAETVERKILYLWPFLHFYPGPDRGRYQATIASLSLQNRLEAVNDPFIDWIKKDPSQDGIKNPIHFLMQSQLFDLVRKVVTSAAFFATSQYSLHATLTTLLSQSQKVSKIAQPHLDKMASLPIPRLLKATQVIAFAPVVIKLIHMALIYVDPKGEKSSLNVLKKTADKAGRGLECLLHLRFSLISLGVSKNLLGCVVSTMYFQAVDYFIEDPQTKLIMQLPTMFKPAYGKEANGLNYFLSILGCTDTSLWPAQGFSLAIKALGSSFFASSDSYNIEYLQTLFGHVEAITIDQASINQLREEFTQAVKKKKIDKVWENRLLNHLRTKVITLCITDPNFEASLEIEGRRDFLKTICCPDLYNSQADKYFDFLVKLSKFEVKLENLEQTCVSLNGFNMSELFDAGVLSKMDFNEFDKFIVEKVEHVFTDEVISNITRDTTSLPHAARLLRSFSRVSEESQRRINQIKSKIFTKINESLPQDVDEKYLQNADEERKIYHLSSWLRFFAVTPNEHLQESLYFTRFHARRFQLHLGYYLKNQLEFQNDKIVAERLLDKVAKETPLIQIEQTALFKTWSEQNDNSEDIQAFISQSQELAFLRDFPQIPAEFRFVNQKLAAKIHQIYTAYKIETGGWSYKDNFPDSDKPQDRFISTQAIQAALH